MKNAVKEIYVHENGKVDVTCIINDKEMKFINCEYIHDNDISSPDFKFTFNYDKLDY